MFTPIKNKKVYQHVIEQFQEMLMKGTLKKGDRLPSERDLVEQLGVSRASIREALRALEIIGLIESKQGEGNFICGDMNTSIFQPLSIIFMLNDGKVENIIEIRTILELEAVVLAAERANEEDKKGIYRVITEMNLAEDKKEAARLDKELHFKIIEITGNTLLVSMYEAIASLIEMFIVNIREIILSDGNNKEPLKRIHEEICMGIIENNPEKAVKAMKDHLKIVNETMSKYEYKTV